MFHILAAFLLWSTTGPFLRESGLPIASFITYSNAFGITLLLVVFRGKLFASWGKLHWKRLCGLAAASGVNIVASFIAYKLTTIGNVLAPHYLAPVIVAIVSPLILHERVSRRAGQALVLAIVGLCCFTWEKMYLGGRNDLIGVGFACVSAIGYSAVILFSRDLARKNENPIIITFITSSMLFVCVLPFTSFEPVPARSLAVASIAGALHLSLAAPVYFHGLKKVKASAAGTMGYMEIVFGLIWGALLYAEELSLMRIVGVCLIVASGVLLFTGADDEEKVPVAANIHI